MPDVYQNEDGVIIITNPDMIKALGETDQMLIKGYLAKGEVILEAKP